tara:strand:+ start:871 stop:1395 length:525 start_codon:yes stop_codon:yes gene_type:complete
MKAQQVVKSPKRRQDNNNSYGGQKYHLVYVGNVYGNNHNGWPWAGVSLSLSEIFRKIPKSQKSKAKIRQRRLTWASAKRKKTRLKRDQSSRDDLTYTLLRAGIQVGDTFLVYHSGEPLVVRKQDAGASYYLATPNKIQIEQVAAGVRKIRRDLRWSHGSFCHGVPSQTPLEIVV